MRIHISLKTPDKNLSRTLSSALKQEAKKALQPLLDRHGADNATLHAVLEKSVEPTKRYELKLHLYLPGRKAVAVQTQGEKIESLAGEAIGKMFWQARRHFERLRKTSEYARKQRRERLHQRKGRLDAIPQRERSLREAKLEALRPDLERAAQRELAYLRAVGFLPSGYPTVGDVVEEAMSEAIANENFAAETPDLLSHVLRYLFNAIDLEVEGERVFAEAIPLDSELSDDADDDAEEMVEEEFYEFYQPDDHVTLADVLTADGGSLPDSGLVSDHGELRVVEILKELPILWRRAMLLREQDGFSLDQIAKVFDMAAQQAEELVQQVHDFVQTKFTETGLDAWLARLGGVKGLLGLRNASGADDPKNT